MIIAHVYLSSFEELENYYCAFCHHCDNTWFVLEKRMIVHKMEHALSVNTGRQVLYFCLNRLGEIVWLKEVRTIDHTLPSIKIRGTFDAALLFRNGPKSFLGMELNKLICWRVICLSSGRLCLKRRVLIYFFNHFKSRICQCFPPALGTASRGETQMGRSCASQMTCRSKRFFFLTK